MALSIQDWRKHGARSPGVEACSGQAMPSAWASACELYMLFGMPVKLNKWAGGSAALLPRRASLTRILSAACGTAKWITAPFDRPHRASRDDLISIKVATSPAIFSIWLLSLLAS